MIPMNEYPAGATIYIPFATYGKTNGESITLTGLAVTDIEIYKNGSVTQRSSDAGYALLDTDGIDFDGITGIHGFSIDLSDNTDAGFYAVGSQYTVVVSAVTVDSQTVNFIADRFRIVPAEGITGYPKVDVHGIAGTAATAAAGIPEVKVASIAANAIAAAAIAADAITAAKIADDAIDAATYAADLDQYAAKVWLQDKNSATATDRYTVIWTKNGADLTSGITSPTIQVIKRSDGSDLVASAAMTEVASLGIYKYDETTNLVVPGESYIIKLQATIDAGTRTSYWVQGRDVSA